MASIGTAYIEVKGDYSGVRRDAKKGLSPLKKVAGLAFAGASTAGIVAYAKSSVNAAQTLAKSTAQIQRVTGMTTQEASKWASVSKSLGVESKALNMGFITLSRSMAAAASGGKDQRKMFEDLGVSMKTLKKGDTSGAVRQLADAFGKIPPGAQKAALAQKLFGRQGQTMLMMLGKGRKGLNDLLADGISMTDKEKEKALEAARAQRRLGIAFDRIKTKIGNVLMPAFADATTAVSDFMDALLGGDDKKGKKKTGGVYKIIEDVKPQLDRIVAWIDETNKKSQLSFDFGKGDQQGLKDSLSSAWTATKPLLNSYYANLQNYIVNLAGSIGGVGKILGGSIGAGAKQLVRSYIGGIVAYIKVSTTPVRAVARGIGRAIWSGLGDAFGAVKGTTGRLMRGVRDGISEAYNGVKSRAVKVGRGIVGGIREFATDAWRAGKLLISRAGDGIASLYNAIRNKGERAARSVISGIRSLFQDGWRAGKGLLSRVGSGIESGIRNLAGIGRRIANTIINAVKSALGIKSPSRVFQQIGSYVVQGFANGINRGNVKGFLGRAFGGTGKFVKGLVKKGMASVGSLPTALAEKLGFFRGGTGGGRRSGTLALAQKIAQMAGLTVGSTFRTPAQNAAAGGVPNSSHLRGSRSNPGATDLNGPVPNLYTGSRIASRFGPIENLVHDAGSGLHLHLAWFARGGKVTRPSYVAGEEAPRYPEYIISTNPRDRSRSHSLWMQAARDIGIGAYKKGGVAKQTARKVKKYLGRDTLLSALLEAQVKPSSDLLKYIGRTPEGRRSKIDKLLKRKGLTNDDRLSLLQLRAGTFQSSSEGTTLAEAMAAQAQALKENTEQMAQNKKFAEQMHQTVRSVTQETLNGLLDQSVGGHLAQFMLTNSPKAAW